MGIDLFITCLPPPTRGKTILDLLYKQTLQGFIYYLSMRNFYYGSRRMKSALGALGYPVGRNKAKNLMQEAGVQARYRKKYKVTTDSNHKKPVFENVLSRQFVTNGPDRAYVGDISYIWTQEGWLYLAVVIDLFSRKIVGWNMIF